MRKLVFLGFGRCKLPAKACRVLFCLVFGGVSFWALDLLAVGQPKESASQAQEEKLQVYAYSDKPMTLS